MSTVEFIFDFGSPNAYFTNAVLPGIAAKHGAKVDIKPILLGGLFKITNNKAPWAAYQGVKGKLEYEMLEIQRFIEKHGLSKYKLNPNFPVNTVTLMRGALVAQEDGFLDDYVVAGLKMMWEDGLAMADKEVFVQAMTEAGFDGADILARAETPEIKQKLIDCTQAAADRGVFGVPTFFVGSEMFFGKDRLGQVEEALAAHT